MSQLLTAQMLSALTQVSIVGLFAEAVCGEIRVSPLRLKLGPTAVRSFWLQCGPRICSLVCLLDFHINYRVFFRVIRGLIHDCF